MGVTFCAVAAEHPLATHAARRAMRRSAAFIEECKRGPAIEAETRDPGKKGHADGARRCAIRSRGDAMPVWVGNYVLMSYGEGAVMGVPAHDERDFEFAKKYRSADRAGHRRRRPHLFDRGLAALVQPSMAAASIRANTMAWISRPRSMRWRRISSG